jgi:zinc/manganese transport system substrate-binding protein
MRIPMKRLQLLALVTVMAMLIAACGGDSEASETTPASDGEAGQQASDSETAQSAGEQLSVVVTTTVWGDVVSNVAGDSADVEVLFPIGADPHDYQLSAAQAASMQQADLVVVNGLLLEEGLLDVIEGLEADGANILELAGLLEPIEFGEGGHDHGDEEGDHDHGDEESDHDHGDEESDHDHGDEESDYDHGDEESDHDHGDEEGHHHHGSQDPHIWMDPLRVADAAELIAEELANLDSSVDWMANATAYADELRALDAEVVSMLAGVPEEGRKLITNHEAFGYFADRYGFEVVGTVIPGGSTLADPSSAELAGLVEVLIDEGVNVIFAETIDPSALAEAIAAEVEGVAVVELFTGSLGASGSGAETYIDLIRTNATRIADALS